MGLGAVRLNAPLRTPPPPPPPPLPRSLKRDIFCSDSFWQHQSTPKKGEGGRDVFEQTRVAGWEASKDPLLHGVGAHVGEGGGQLGQGGGPDPPSPLTS